MRFYVYDEKLIHTKKLVLFISEKREKRGVNTIKLSIIRMCVYFARGFIFGLVITSFVTDFVLGLF